MENPEKFYNRGFGWVCRGCEPDTPSPETGSERARYLTEGEAEKRGLAVSARARWADSERTELHCPICGAKEAIRRLDAVRE